MSDPSAPDHDDDARPLIRGRGMAHAVLSFGSTVVLGLLGAVLISRLYGVAVVGEFALASAPYVLVSQFSNLGEQYALIHRLSTERPDSSTSASLFSVVFAFSTGITLLSAAVAAPVAVLLLRGPADQPDLVGPALVLIAAYVLGANPAWNIDMLQTAFRSTGALLVGRFFDVGFLLLTSVVLAFVRERTTETLVLSTVITFTFTLLLRIAMARRVLTGRPTRASLREAVRELPALVRFGMPIVPGAVAQALTGQAGLWLISAVRSVTVLGAYSRANNLSGRLQEAGYRLSEVMLPGLSQACRGGDYAGAAASFSWWRRLVALGLGAACAPAAGAAVGLLAVFGPGFSTAALPLAIMLVGYATVVLSLVHSSLLLALERPGVVSRMVLLRCAVALALVGPLTLALGATGAALALTAGFLVEFAVILRRTDRELRPTGATISSLPWGRLVVSLVLSAGTARLVDVALEGVLGTLAALLAGLAVFAGVAIATGQVQRSELQEGVRRVSGRGRSVAAAGGPPEPPPARSSP